jgi:hypothetical protein
VTQPPRGLDRYAWHTTSGVSLSGGRKAMLVQIRVRLWRMSYRRGPEAAEINRALASS